MDRDYYSKDELLALGFSRVGDGIQVSRKVSFYGIKGFMGNQVRIDDFCILKGRIEIGTHVHISAFCLLSGVCGVVCLSDFSTLAARVSIYTGSDDYRADALSSSTVPPDYLVTIKGDVKLGRAALIGAHSVLLPGATIGEGASVGALCIVHQNLPAGTIVSSQRGELTFKGNRDVNKILAMGQELLQHERAGSTNQDQR